MSITKLSPNWACQMGPIHCPKFLLPGTSPLFQQLKIFNLDQIRQYQTGIFVYRTNHNLLPAIFQNYFINIKDIHQHFTRGSDALFLTVVRTNYRKHSIRFMGPVLWNELPKLIRDVSNLSSFKKGLCKYLLDKLGCFLPCSLSLLSLPELIHTRIIIVLFVCCCSLLNFTHN